MLNIKFGFDWPSGFRAEDDEYYDNVHVYCLEVGEEEPLGSNFNDILTVFPIQMHR